MQLNYRERITELREDNDKKQKEIAEILGIKQSAYSKYEKGRTKIQVDDIIKLCIFYNVSADYILGLSDEKKSYKKEK